jgi:TRAP-type uncharacterized transport system substrate-binding protein
MDPKLARIVTESIKIGSGFGGSYSMSASFCQLLSEKILKRPVTMISPAPNRLELVAEGILDLCWAVPSIAAEWAYHGRGDWKAAPLSNLRAIARLPQNDRQMIAVAPYAICQTLEQVAEKRPPLGLGIRINVHIGEESKRQWAYAVNAIIHAYGFDLYDLEDWGGQYWPVSKEFMALEEQIQQREVDFVIGDASTQPIWKNLAGHGFKFLSLSETAMMALERAGFERNIVPAGFLPGITAPLLAVDESDFLLLTSTQADDDLVYAVTKTIDQNRGRIEASATAVQYVSDKPESPSVTLRSSLTSPIQEQWKTRIPLHRAATCYYSEMKYPIFS